MVGLTLAVVVQPLQDLLHLGSHGDGCADRVRAVQSVVQVLDVQIDGRKYRGGSTYCPLTEWKTTNGTIIDVPQTFLIGAAQSADGSKKQQFWLGTLYHCKVYKGLLSDDKVNDYIEKGW